MKNWTIRLLVLILIVGAGTAGYFLARQNNTIDSTTARVTTLKSEVTTLQNNLTTLESDISAINPVLQGHINATIDLINSIQPVILRITVNGDGFVASGSGFIIRSDGYAITNQHVIDSAKSISITTMNGDKYSAIVTFADSRRDLALLKVDTSRTDFPAATLGLWSDIILGDDVVACGFPLGLDLPGPASFTRGIISAVRILNGLQFVQTDFEIDPGSSGGCLVNLDSEIVGVTSDAVLPPNQSLEAIALAIPVSDVQTFILNNLK